MPVISTTRHFGHQFIWQSGRNIKGELAPTSKPEKTAAEELKPGVSPGKNSPQRKSDYFAAQTVISTIVPGVRTAPTAVRVGKFPRSTQAIQASFIASLSVASCM